jgi:Zn-dependent protease with chaperone function
MKLKIVVIATCLLISRTGYSQDFNNYTNVKNVGSMPNEFKYSATEVYKQNLKNEQQTKNSEVKLKDKKEFLLESNFATTDLLRSGKILFNSPLNTYVNKVTDLVLQSNPALSGKVKVYIVQSPVVNAFTFNDGKIFINMGLLAHLQNEAQLAFIIAHEVSHYTKGHSLNVYIERKKISKGVDQYEDFDESDKVFASNSFNKEQEIEADADGLRLFSKTGYDLAEARNALALLHYADQPFDNKVFSVDFFNRQYLQIPKIFVPDSVDDISLYNETDITGDEEDEKSNKKVESSTHPTISKRIRTLDKVNLGKYDHEGGQKFLVSESDFMTAQTTAQFELCRLYSLAYRPLENLFNIYLLEKKYPNNKYLLENKLRCYYQIISAVNKGYRTSIISKPDKLEGEMQKMHSIFYSMSKEEVSALCLRHAWDVKMQLAITETSPLNAFMEGIVYSFANNISTKVSYFKTAKDYNDSLVQSWYKPVVADNNTDKKGKKKSKFIKPKRKGGSFASYVMIPYLNNNEFKDYFNKVSERIDEKTKEDEDNETEFEKTKASIKITKTKNLGIKNIVFLDPTYLVIDQRKKQSNRYIESEEKELTLKSTIYECSKAANLDAKFIISSDIESSDEYNEFMILKSRMSECFNNEDLKPLATDKEAIDLFAKKHNTQYVATLINVALADYRDSDGILYGCIFSVYSFGLYLPFFIYSLLTPENSNALVLAVYDVKSGEIKYGNIVYSSENDNKDLLKSELYNMLTKLK